MFARLKFILMLPAPTAFILAQWKAIICAAFPFSLFQLSPLNFQKKNPHTPPQGFTTIELLVVLAILLIMTALAMPSLSTFMQSNQTASIQSEFMGALSLARNEAAKRGVPVMVEALSPATSNEFGGGWKIWADTNNNGAQETNEPTIRKRTALSSSLKMGNGSTTAISFNSKGYLASPNVIQLKLCHAGTHAAGYQFTIQYNGLSDVASNITCP